MSETFESIKNFARRVLLNLAGSEELLHQAPVEAAERAFDGLQRRLAKVVGGEGFRAMLVRSIVMARREFPWLGVVQAATDGTFTGLRAVALEHEGVEIEAGFVCLLAHLLELLTSLIGGELTGRLLHDVWPELPFGQSNVEAQEVDG